MVYMATDGFADQFGGEKGKKFKAKAFRALLIRIQDKSMEEQKIIIDNDTQKDQEEVRKLRRDLDD